VTSNPVVGQTVDPFRCRFPFGCEGGRLEVFVQGGDLALWHISETAPSATTWNPWNSLGGILTSDVAVAANAALFEGVIRVPGELEVFVRGSDDALWHNSQQAVGGPAWSGWTSLGGILASNPVVAQNSDGRLEVFVRGKDSALWHISETALSFRDGGLLTPSAATWNAWGSLGGILTSDVAVAANADGRLEVFARGIGNALWHNSQLAAGGPAWSGWSSLGGIVTSNPAFVQNPDGRLEIFVQGGDFALWHMSETAPSAVTWNPWSSLGGALTSDVAVAANADGRPEVLARGIDYALWHNSQLAAGGPAWSGWTSLGEPVR